MSKVADGISWLHLQNSVASLADRLASTDARKPSLDWKRKSVATRTVDDRLSAAKCVQYVCAHETASQRVVSQSHKPCGVCILITQVLYYIAIR